MKLLQTYRLLLAFFLLPVQHLTAQTDPVIKTFINDFSYTAERYRFSEIFLHVDKTVYTQNEYIWFNLYLLHAAAPMDQYHTLYTTLYSKDSLRVMQAEQFVIKGGAATGSLSLNDSIPPGNYILAVHTNIISGNPANDFFYQPVKIISPYREPYKIIFNGSQGNRVQGDSVFFGGHINRVDGEPVAKLRLDYRLQGDGNIVNRGHIKPNEAGLFSGAVAGDFSKLNRLNLSGRVRSDDYFVPFEKELRSDTAEVQLRLFAEGGHLIQGIKSLVTVEAVNAMGKPVAIPLQVFANDTLVSEAHTAITGLGQFTITPRPGITYTVRARNRPGRRIHYRFPGILPAGSIIRLAEGVMRTDTVVVDVASTVKNVTAYMVLHDYQRIHYFSKFTITSRLGFMAIPVAGVPRGIYAVTLLNADGEPVAERCIFLHYDKRPQIEITTDSAVYHTRSKITLQVSATDPDGQPMPTYFSAALVQHNHIDSLRMTSIFSACFLDPFYKRMTGRPMNFVVTESRQALERALLTKFATLYAPYKGIITTKDTTLQQLGYSGYVLYRNQPPDKPVELVLVKSNQLSKLSTMGDGSFTIAPEELETNPGEKIMAFVNRKKKDGYAIVLNNEKALLDSNANVYFFEQQPAPPEQAADTVRYAAETDPLYKILPPATVKARRSDLADLRPMRYGYPVFKSKYCTEYICSGDTINCRYHGSGRKPVSGRVYTMYNKLKKSYTRVVFENCRDGEDNAEVATTRFLYKLHTRNYAYEFIPADYSQDAASRPEISSTVYWGPILKTGDDGKATLSFYTNDLTGAFVLHVQAISTRGVFSKKMLLQVTK